MAGSVADNFAARHIGPRPAESAQMLQSLGFDSWERFLAAVLPAGLARPEPLQLSCFPQALSEAAALRRLAALAAENQLSRSYIGWGYHGTLMPPVIQRSILENPAWYTHYTPYQPEISQGRLEALLNFQTMVADLTGLKVANASLLDEATAAAEAMTLALAAARKQGLSAPRAFLVDRGVLPSTQAVLQTRAAALGIELRVADSLKYSFGSDLFGVLWQYPDRDGALRDPRPLVSAAQAAGVMVIMAADILALSLVTPPGELGADVAIGSTQRLGIPLGYGGPHAAYMAVREQWARLVPGRLVGISKDATGQAAYRLALQTREQHIRREKATSNICTAQVLLAVLAGMYAVYHGPRGLERIAQRVHRQTAALAAALKGAGLRLGPEAFFDTLVVVVSAEKRRQILDRAAALGINLRIFDPNQIGVTLDETVTDADLADLVEVFTGRREVPESSGAAALPPGLRRQSTYLSAAVFNRYHSETEFLRYVKRLESRDLSLVTAMIPLGSCTMKLNSAAALYPISWPAFAALHPWAPPEQAAGYAQLFRELETSLAEITGMAAVSLQPNAGSQGEYAGLLAIRAYLRGQGQSQRQLCLIPKSAHGTNPASAVMAGFRVLAVECDPQGNIDRTDLEQKIAAHLEELGALMITYPSTHGVFEEFIPEICAAVHQAGGQVYLDGANLNALVGLVRPVDLGVDVLHINLHKTFSIPHGGGGPGVGPIAVAGHLAPYLPGHPLVRQTGRETQGPVAAAPWGSAGIMPIPWMYLALLGAAGLRQATLSAILAANYVAQRLKGAFPLLYQGAQGLVAHECILDCRHFKQSAGVEVEDIAKRLMDYGFHAPTVSFPVPGTLMIEPTESESLKELDRFCEALLLIREEIREIETGGMDPQDNLLKNAPHTAAMVSASAWAHPYTRERAAFPLPGQQSYKFWPAVARIDGAYGDRNLLCSCG